MRFVPDIVALAALILFAGLQFWAQAGPGRLPQNLDLMLQYVPNAGYLGRSLAALRIPLWNPFLGAGMPFAADPGTGTWYLPNWPLLAALPLEAGVRVILWLHLLWAAGGTYAFARVALRVGPAAAWIAAATFALATWLPGLAGMPVVFTAVAWLPWVLLAGDRAAVGGRQAVGLLGLIGALQIVAGWPAGAYLAWAALFTVEIIWRADWRVPARIGAGAAVAALLAGVLLVPAAEFVGQTNYADTRPLARVAGEGYLTLLSWLRPAGGTGSLESSQLYLGMAPVALALAAALFDRRRLAIALVVVAVLALLVAAGTHGPLFALLYRFLPGFRILYLPARLGVIAAFAIACLAGLGLDRLARGPWTLRSAAIVGAAAVLLVPALALQFWWSEGYDDFRRLLTNLGRFTGSPFVTRGQEAHYAVIGVLSVGALAFGALRRRTAAGALVALTAADLFLAQRTAAPPSFDAGAWYAPAFEQAQSVAAAIGHDRLAGLQWHGDRHFLAGFPAAARPELLPPNLSLLVGLRDAQGYNPLLLRRAASYFAAANGGTGDDHWLWLADFASPRVDALAVRRVLAAGAGWRVTATPLAGPSALPPPGAAQTLWRGASPVPAATVYVVSYLGEATAVPQGTPAVEVQLLDAAGGVQSFVLRTGVDTAEWAYGRPDVRASAQHRQAPIALETPLISATGGAYPVYEYLATFGLTPGTLVAEIRARSLLSTASAYVQGIWVERPDQPYTPAPGGLDNRDALPRFRIEGGSVDVRRDDPERIDLRVSTPVTVGGTLVVADSYYPGWIATVDGAGAGISPRDELFRAIAVPAGTHDVSLAYRPASFAWGLALTAGGIVILAALLRPGRTSRR